MDRLKQLFEETMKDVLEFRLELSILEYKKKQLSECMWGLENELDEKNNPINGIEVKINGEDLQKWGEEICNDAIILERAIERGGITTTLAGEPFRYEEMSFVYLFSILEDFGNSILEINKCKYYKEIQENEKSWHSKINKYNENKGVDFIQILGEIFQLGKDLDINEKIISEFIRLKTVRNNIVHQLKYPDDSLNFKEGIDNIIVIMCYLYYINDSKREKFSVFPWFGYENI